ncbi:MAG TPA: winged helix-turn-helix domain-containing protein [Pyrinomonadaceae bacterium]|nr:winged helix-turn-helix domain-containing protein [Pyrinomonadaceae bacterium]
MRVNPTNQRSYEFGDFRLDSVQRVLRRRGELVPLTPKVFDLLLLLIENHGQVVEKDLLMRELWPDTFVEEGNLTQNISILRKILSDDGHQYIQTMPRRGYRFVGQVRAMPYETLAIEEHSLTRVTVEETQIEDAFVRKSILVADSPAAISQVVSQHLSWRKVAVVSVVALAVVAALGIAWTILGPRRVAGRNPPPFNVNNVTLRTITSSGNVVYGVMSDDGQFVVYSTVDEDNRYALWLQRTGSREVLQLIPPSARPVGPAAISHDGNWIYYGESSPDEPLKGITIYRMPLLGGTSRKVLEAVHVFAALSPDDQHILLHRFKQSGGVDVISVNALDGSDETLIASSNIASDYLGTRWSPDGSKLVFFSSEQRQDGTYWSLSEMPARGGAHKTILPPAQRKIWFIAWADQGRGIVMTATDPVTKIAQLYYVSYPDGETRRITNDLIGYTSISVGGETIMAGKVERQSRVWVTNWPNPGPARQAIERDMADGFAWMPDGRIVYDTNDDGKSHLWTTDLAGTQRQQLSPDNVDERQPEVSPDGKLITFISKRSGGVALWVMDAEGRNPRRLTADGLPVWRPRFAPDGQSIFFLMERNDRAFLARISLAGGEPVVISDDVYEDSFFDVSPDGQRIAYSTKDNNRRMTRVAVRTMTGVSPARYYDIEPSYFLRWTPDGQNLAYAQYPQDKKWGQALWLQPISGGSPQQVLNVTPDLLYWAAWSPDGKQLALSHGRFVRDIVLVSRNHSIP